MAAHPWVRGLYLCPADRPRGLDQPEGHPMTSDTTLPTPVAVLRSRARSHPEDGAVTQGYRADRGHVLAMLIEALATAIVCMLRYRRHHFMARGIHARRTADEFLAHANEELGHADRLAERIVQLGGEPDFAPDGLATRSTSPAPAWSTGSPRTWSPSGSRSTATGN
jgi:bacterioferritin